MEGIKGMRVSVGVVRFILGAAIVVSVAVILFGYRRQAPVVACKDCNVLVIAVDPMRWDDFGRTCRAELLTPAIDKILDGGYVFTNAVAASSWTLPSAMSVMTGVYPSVHGVINKEILGKTVNEGVMAATLSKTAPKLLSLVSEFSRNGYKTAGFAGGAALHPDYGFGIGFDSYTSDGDFESIASPSASALSFVRDHKDAKLFLYIHGFDVHGQYTPPEGVDRLCVSSSYTGKLTGAADEQKEIREQGVRQGNVFLTPEDAQFLRAIHDGKLHRLDSVIGDFISTYTSLTPDKKTIIVITSNHGDEFYEHGRIDHGMTLYDEVIRIPLAIVIPGTRAGKITQQVRNIDLLPTLLSLVGIRHESGALVEGKSLLPALSGTDMKLDAYPETSYRYAVFLTGLRRRDGWKLITDRESQSGKMYMTRDDAAEIKNKYGNSTDVEAQLTRALTEHTKRMETDHESVRGDRQ